MPARLKNGKREQDARRAFTLIEVMVALAITAIMVIGITSVLTFNFIYEDLQELRAIAMVALARRIAGILYAMWRDNSPYNAANLRMPRPILAKAS